MKSRHKKNNSKDGLSTSFDRDRYRKKLSRLLSECHLETLLRAVWEIRKIQSDDRLHSEFFLTIPPLWRTTEIKKGIYFLPWRLETMVNLAFEGWINSPRPLRRQLDLRHPDAIITLYNTLHKFENASEGMSLRQVDVIQQMFRLTRRQFEWQEGFWNAPRILLYLSIFGGPNARKHFENDKGISLETFVAFGYAITSVLSNNFRISKNIDLSVVSIDQKTRDICWSLVSATLAIETGDGIDTVQGPCRYQ